MERQKKKIEYETSTQLVIKKKRSLGMHVVLLWTGHNSRLALHHVNELIDNSDEEVLPNENYHLSFTLSTQYGALLMGAGAKNHKAIQDHYGIRIFLNPSDGHNLQNLVLSGPRKRLSQC
uniref:Uncharacterized protein n=1 Tax=Ditylenchus dipsaci TaxID=166011 RepID=A0A915CWR0_9BILA